MKKKQRISTVKSLCSTFGIFFKETIPWPFCSFFFPFVSFIVHIYVAFSHCTVVIVKSIKKFIWHKSQNWSLSPLGNASFISFLVLTLRFTMRNRRNGRNNNPTKRMKKKTKKKPPNVKQDRENDFIKMGCTSWEINGFFQIKYFCIIILILIRNMVVRFSSSSIIPM